MPRLLIRLSIVALVLIAAPVHAITVDSGNYGKLAMTTTTPFTLVASVLDTENAPFASDPQLTRVTASDVLADATATMVPSASCTATERAAAGGAASKAGYVAYCWSGSADRTGSSWYPQGISSTSDAYTVQTADGSSTGRTALAVSWYNKSTPNQGARISFVNASSGGASLSTYAHVLLVEPKISNGHLTFAPLATHAGGLAWYGTRLFSADSGRGIRVFDTARIYRIPAGQDSTKIGWDTAAGRYHAFGYTYVMPLQMSYLQSTAGNCGVQTDPDGTGPLKAYTNPLCFSWIGLDRGTSPDSLVAGEYRTLGDLEASDTRIRLTRWSLNYHDRGLCDSTGAAGTTCGSARTLADGQRITVDAVYMTETPRLQGGLSWSGKFSLSQSLSDSLGNAQAGSLYASVPGTNNVYGSTTRYSWTVGAEDVTLWRAATTSGTLGSSARVWTLTEHPGQRLLLGVYYSSVDG
ncbi:MAG TPA: hypothetical protein VFZ66_22055 [Herpetosiphonaceae bacterium]